MSPAHHDDHAPPDAFTDDERRLFAAWRAPEPPADFAARVVGRYRAGGAGSARLDAFRGLAVAGMLVLAAGGFFAARAFGVGGAGAAVGGSGPPPLGRQARVAPPPDAGPVEAGFDG